MKTPKHVRDFCEAFSKKLNEEGWVDLDVRTMELIAQGQIPKGEEGKVDSLAKILTETFKEMLGKSVKVGGKRNGFDGG